MTSTPEDQATTIAELRERLREAEKLTEQLHAKMTCMCGSDINHSAWEGHSPVSMYDYALEAAEARATAAERALVERDAQVAEYVAAIGYIAGKAGAGLCQMSDQGKHLFLEDISSKCEKLGFDILGDQKTPVPTSALAAADVLSAAADETDAEDLVMATEGTTHVQFEAAKEACRRAKKIRRAAVAKYREGK